MWFGERVKHRIAELAGAEKECLDKVNKLLMTDTEFMMLKEAASKPELDALLGEIARYFNGDSDFSVKRDMPTVTKDDFKEYHGESFNALRWEELASSTLTFRGMIRNKVSQGVTIAIVSNSDQKIFDMSLKVISDLNDKRLKVVYHHENVRADDIEEFRELLIEHYSRIGLARKSAPDLDQ